MAPRCFPSAASSSSLARPDVIVLFTDFGRDGPYVAQMEAQLMRRAPGVPVLDLFADVPAWDVRAGAYLLAAYAPDFPAGTVFLCVIDPGVGGSRLPVVLWADGRWYVGPGNGLFTLVARRAAEHRFWRIDWRPDTLSASFHGRDLFAPVAARLARGSLHPGTPIDADQAIEAGWPDDLPCVIYVDGYGNAMTGLRAGLLDAGARLTAGGTSFGRARTFSDVGVGEAFWYENANGLAEIAVNQGRAAERFALAPGVAVSVAVQHGASR